MSLSMNASQCDSNLFENFSYTYNFDFFFSSMDYLFSDIENIMLEISCHIVLVQLPNISWIINHCLGFRSESLALKLSCGVRRKNVTGIMQGVFQIQFAFFVTLSWGLRHFHHRCSHFFGFTRNHHLSCWRRSWNEWIPMESDVQ